MLGEAFFPRIDNATDRIEEVFLSAVSLLGEAFFPRIDKATDRIEEVFLSAVS